MGIVLRCREIILQSPVKLYHPQQSSAIIPYFCTGIIYWGLAVVKLFYFIYSFAYRFPGGFIAVVPGAQHQISVYIIYIFIKVLLLVKNPTVPIYKLFVGY